VCLFGSPANQIAHPQDEPRGVITERRTIPIEAEKISRQGAKTQRRKEEFGIPLRAWRLCVRPNPCFSRGACIAVLRLCSRCNGIDSHLRPLSWQKRSEPAVVPLTPGKTRCCFLAVYGSAKPGRIGRRTHSAKPTFGPARAMDHGGIAPFRWPSASRG